MEKLFGVFLMIINISLISLIISSSTVDSTGDHTLRWAPIGGSTRCQGSIAECMMKNIGDDDDDEFKMDSEINRRILATSKYISYDALRRDTIPCSQRGASYYNCHQGAEANPYDRGCSAITRCRS